MSSTSSLSDRWVRVFGFAEFGYDAPLPEAAELISLHILGGAPFGGLNDHVRDEVPAVYASRLILGCRAVVSGGDGEFCLEIEPNKVPHSSTGVVVDEADLSLHLKRLLSGIPGVIVRHDFTE